MLPGSRFARGLVTSPLFVNEDLAPGRAGQRGSQLPRRKNGEISQIVLRCVILNDAHAPLGKLHLPALG